MKWVAVLVALVGLASARTIFDYERDGLENEQQGQPGKAVEGEYEWRAPDGKVVEISYVADHLGFRLVDDPETTAPDTTDAQSSSAQSRTLEQEGEGEEEEEGEEAEEAEEDEGAAEVRTEEELEEEEGEEESEGKSEGTEEEEESGSTGEEKSAEPEKEGGEAEASVEPEEKSEGEEKSADSEGKGALSEEKSAGPEAEGAETEAEEKEKEGVTKDAEAKVSQDSSASDGVVIVAEAESKQTPVLVPVKVESTFPSETPVTPEPIIATAEVLPPVAPLVAPVTVEKSEAVSPVVIDNVSFGPSVGPQDFVFVVVPPVEQDVTVADTGVVDPAPVAVETYQHSSGVDVVAMDSTPVEPVAAPNLLFALVASPEAIVVPAEPPVLGKVQVSSPVGVSQIDSGIAAFAVSQDSFQTADQRLSGSFDPVGNLPTLVSQFPVSEVDVETADRPPRFTTFNEVVEISPEPLSAPELPSPLPVIQIEEVDPSFVSVEVSPAPNPRPDTNPSSLFNQEVVEVPFEEPQFINPIVPPPFAAPQVSSNVPSFSVVEVVLPSHRFDASKSARSMDSIPVFVDNSKSDSANALFFAPEIFQEEAKSQPSDVVEVVVPEENVMTIAKALIQPPPASAQPLTYTVESSEPQLQIFPIFAEAEAASVNDIPISVKDESTFSTAGVESSFVVVDMLPADPTVLKESLTFSGAIPEPVAPPTAPREPLFVELNGNPGVQTSDIVAPGVFALEVESSQIPVREEIIVVSEEPANSSPNAKVTIVAEDEPLFTFDEDVRVAKIQSPPLLPPLMKPSVLLS